MSKRKKRCRHEMIAAILEVLDEGAKMNKNQIRLATGIGGQHLNALVNNCVELGVMEWTGEITRPSQSENYGQKLQSTSKGSQWLEVWRLLQRLENPNSKIRVTIQSREKSET